MHMVIEGNYGPVRPDPKTRGRGMLLSVIVTTHINRKIIEVCLNIFSINVLYQENNFK